MIIQTSGVIFIFHFTAKNLRHELLYWLLFYDLNSFEEDWYFNVHSSESRRIELNLKSWSSVARPVALDINNIFTSKIMPDGVYFLVVLNIMIHIAKVPEGASILTINFLEIISQLIINYQQPFPWLGFNEFLSPYFSCICLFVCKIYVVQLTTHSYLHLLPRVLYSTHFCAFIIITHLFTISLPHPWFHPSWRLHNLRLSHQIAYILLAIFLAHTHIWVYPITR